MAMRLPGGVRSAEDSWRFFTNTQTGHCAVPKERYGVDAFYNVQDERCIKSKHGDFLPEDPACFDAQFFSASEHEASSLDPQLRLLL